MKIDQSKLNWGEKEEKEYKEFTEKFKPKKTTDECYTPDNIYEAVCEFCEEEYNLDRKNFVRPFYPGGDYQVYDYKENDVVIDNPPFSILSEILNFYKENDIKFFLFCPTLTAATKANAQHCVLVTDAKITFDNGAKIAVSFVTNLEKLRVRTAPTLSERLKTEERKNSKCSPHHAKSRGVLNKYPPNILRMIDMKKLAGAGVEFEVGINESEFVRNIDSQFEEERKEIHSFAYLISNEKAKEKEEKMKKSCLGDHRKEWQFSPREIEIVKSLGEKNKGK